MTDDIPMGTVVKADTKSLPVPKPRRGWLKKQSRKGLIQNWKKRFFTLEFGKLKYYESENEKDSFKGELSLSGTEYVPDTERDKSCQLHIVAYNGDRNILMEAESMEDMSSWVESIRQHILYANDFAEVTNDPRRISAVLRRASINSTIISVAEGSSADEAERDSTMKDTQKRVSTGSNANIFRERDRNNAPETVPSSYSMKHEEKGTKQAIELDITDIRGVFRVIGTEIVTVFSDMVKCVGDSTTRNKFRERWKIIVSSYVRNAKDGKIGQRGEKWVLTVALLAATNLFEIQPSIEWLLRILLRLVSPFLIATGLYLMVYSVWCLGAHNAPFLTPAAGHKLVTSGAYALARHPLYGGLVLVCLGRAMVADCMVKCFLSIALFIVADSVCSFEEAFLVAKHNPDYVEYSREKKKMIPFVY